MHIDQCDGYDTVSLRLGRGKRRPGYTVLVSGPVRWGGGGCRKRQREREQSERSTAASSLSLLMKRGGSR